MNLKGLVIATNAILGRATPSVPELENALKVGCRELDALSRDEVFVAQIKTGTQLSAAALQLCDDLQSFEDFVSKEFSLLRDAGLNHATAQALLGYIRTARPLLGLGQARATDALAALAHLRDRTCGAADRIEVTIREQEGRHRIAGFLKRAGKVCGGAVLAAVNGSSVAVLGPIGVDLSVGLAGAIIYDGLKGE